MGAKNEKLNILMMAPEGVPFCKTGGLADVVGALPKALRNLGHDVRVVLPKYSIIDAEKHGVRPYFGPLGVWMGGVQEWAAVDIAELECENNRNVPVYFIEHNNYFNREGIYNDSDNNGYLDNAQRYAFFTRAALQLSKDINFSPDIVHAHDWQTALAPAYLKVWHWDDPILGEAASVLTIHNIGYRGVFGAEHYDYIGLQWANFTPDKLEDHGEINFLKGGINFADLVNTVSPTYAEETSSFSGYGMEQFLQKKGDDYIGIVNGVDYSHWDPRGDTLIPENYSLEDFEGKKSCKKKLQERLNLEIREDVPVVGVVSRMAHQKGLDVLAEAIAPAAEDMEVQFAILGSGDKGLEEWYQSLAEKYPDKVGVYIGYNNEMAHWVEAGSDFFIMPSIYEPCGLNQIYSMRYGTLPIVRSTGGLADTVEQYNEHTGKGTGFQFEDLNKESVYSVIGWAVSTYFDRPEHLNQMIERGMKKEFSWKNSAKKYLEAYKKAIRNKNSL